MICINNNKNLRNNFLLFLNLLDIVCTFWENFYFVATRRTCGEEHNEIPLLPPYQKMSFQVFRLELFTHQINKAFYCSFLVVTVHTILTYLYFIRARHICRDIGVQPLPPSQKRVFSVFRRERFTNLEI